MTNWENATLGALLPGDLSSLTSSASTTAQGAGTVLDAIKAAAELAKTLLTDFPAYDFLQGFDTLVQDFRNDFLATGLYGSALWDYPLVQLFRSGSGGEPFDEFVNDVASSLTDSSDPNIPPFVSDTAMIVIVGGGTGIPGVLTAIEAAATAFEWWEEANESVEALQKKSDDEQLREVEEAIAGNEIKFSTNPSAQTSQLLSFKKARKDARESLTSSAVAAIGIPTPASTPSEIIAFMNAVDAEIAASGYPNWQQMSLKTVVPPLVDVVDQVFDPLVSSLATGRGALSNANDMIDTLSAKIDSLNNIVTDITNYINRLNAVLALTGLSAIFLSSTSGVSDLATQLRNSTNRPFAGVNGFYFGFALVAGGVAVTPFTNLFGPIA